MSNSEDKHAVLFWSKKNPTLTEIFNQAEKVDPNERWIIYDGKLADERGTYSFPLPIPLSDVRPFEDAVSLEIYEECDYRFHPVQPYSVALYVGEAPPPCELCELTDDLIPAHVLNACDELLELPPTEYTRHLPEDETRKELIDPILRRKGWIVGENYAIEQTFVGRSQTDRYRIDYLLLGKSQRGWKPIGLIEAKHKGLGPETGLEQGKLYAYEYTKASLRFVFSTNGHDFVEYDWNTGICNASQPMLGFPTPQQLEQRLQDGSRRTVGRLKPERKRGRSQLDVDSIDAARAVFNRLMPDPSIRKQGIDLLIDSVQLANSLGAARWQVTLNPRYVRINVGKIEVVAIFEGMFHLILDSMTLDEATREKAERYAVLSGPTVYTSVTSSIGCNLLPEVWKEAYPVLRPAYEALIRKAAMTAQRPSWYKSHSAGVLKYLRLETKRTLPNPSYHLPTDE